MEELIGTLEEECRLYEQLLALSQKKTPVLVSGKIEELTKITDEEQVVVDRISALDNKRESVTKDIAEVLNKDVSEMKLTKLIEMLAGQPKEQARLSEIHDRLRETAGNVRRINEHNQDLISHSLEMVEFDLNMLQALRQAPETANYGRSGYSAGDVLGSLSGGFDAKQ
ncbi:MAG: flagellar protein FlgN [Lachnospiraceae bacterium]|nr:flagellar protein FlgN [Lachnospiraceae bacterium]